jgi:hypothetical protein
MALSWFSIPFGLMIHKNNPIGIAPLLALLVTTAQLNCKAKED